MKLTMAAKSRKKKSNNERGSKEWSFHPLFRGIIFFGFGMLMISFIVSGDIQYYISPKMMPFIYFAVGVFILLTIVQVLRSSPKGQKREASCSCGTSHEMKGSVWKKALIYSVFIIPLLMGFLLPEKALDGSAAANRGVYIGGAGMTPNEIDETDERAPTRMSRIQSMYFERMAEGLKMEQKIVVEDDMYVETLHALDLNLEDLIGKEVEIIGFAFREPGLANDELILARFAMTCCTADVTAYGMLIKGEETRDIFDDEWVRAHGVLHYQEYNGAMVPVLHVIETEHVQRPDAPYVYPNF